MSGGDTNYSAFWLWVINPVNAELQCITRGNKHLFPRPNLLTNLGVPTKEIIPKQISTEPFQFLNLFLRVVETHFSNNGFHYETQNNEVIFFNL